MGKEENVVDALSKISMCNILNTMGTSLMDVIMVQIQNDPLILGPSNGRPQPNYPKLDIGTLLYFAQK